MHIFAYDVTYLYMNTHRQLYRRPPRWRYSVKYQGPHPTRPSCRTPWRTRVPTLWRHRQPRTRPGHPCLQMAPVWLAGWEQHWLQIQVQYWSLLNWQNLRLHCGCVAVPVYWNFIVISPCFAIFKNVVHSLEPGEIPSNSASHRPLNYVQRS